MKFKKLISIVLTTLILSSMDMISVNAVANKNSDEINSMDGTNNIIIDDSELLENDGNEPKNAFKSIYYGRYEQDNNISNGKEPIEWIILDENETGMFVISKYVLDTVKQCLNWGTTIVDDGVLQASGPITWTNIPVRTWLNTTFLNAAFTDEEQESISVTAVHNPDHYFDPTYVDGPTHMNSKDPQTLFVHGGGTTYDKIFLLNIEETIHYFNPLSTGNFECTDYVKSIFGTGPNWQLRSPGYIVYPDNPSEPCSISVFFHNVTGNDPADGIKANDWIGSFGPFNVRPAMWLRKDAVNDGCAGYELMLSENDITVNSIGDGITETEFNFTSPHTGYYSIQISSNVGFRFFCAPGALENIYLYDADTGASIAHFSDNCINISQLCVGAVLKEGQKVKFFIPSMDDVDFCEFTIFVDYYDLNDAERDNYKLSLGSNHQYIKPKNGMIYPSYYSFTADTDGVYNFVVSSNSDIEYWCSPEAVRRVELMDVESGKTLTEFISNPNYWEMRASAFLKKRQMVAFTLPGTTRLYSDYVPFNWYVSVDSTEENPFQLDKSEMIIKIEEEEYITCTGNGKVNWTSSDKNILEISNTSSDNKIKVIGKKKGKATVTAINENGEKAYCEVTVQGPLSLDKESITLQLGKDEELNCFKDGVGSVRWISSDENIVSIIYTGSNTKIKVKGEKQGTATITVTNSQGHTASCRIIVQGSLNLDKDSITLQLGKDAELNCEKNGVGSIRWTSSNENIVSIAYTGSDTKIKVKGIQQGIATITASNADGSTVSCKVTVRGSISLNKDSMTIIIGDTERISCITDGVGSVKWNSSDSSIAEIISTGSDTEIKVEGKKQGTATITAKSSDGSTASCKVTVLGSLSLSEKSIKLGINETEVICCAYYGKGSITWSCSNDNIVSICSIEAGKRVELTGKRQGTTTITAKSSDGSTASCEVTVNGSVSLDKDALTLSVGDTEEVTCNFDGIGNVKWASSNESIVSVIRTGSEEKIKVKGLLSGTATITATISDGSTAKCNVTVQGSLTLLQPSITVLMGETRELFCTNDGNGTLTWTSNDDTIAFISKTSDKVTVNGRKPGETEIIVASSDGSKTSCRVIVRSSVTMEKENVTLEMGQSEVITYTNEGNGVLTWMYPGDGTISMDVALDGSTITVTGKRQGTATITLTSSDGGTANCKVTVLGNVSLDNTSVILKPGNDKLVHITKAGHGVLSLVNSDDSVASAELISGKIQIHANKRGTTTVTISSTDGSTASCKVTVLGLLSLEKSTFELKPGEYENIAITNEGNEVISLTNSDNSVASANLISDEKIQVIAKKQGTTTVTVASVGGSTASCKVTVLGYVSLNRETLELKIDEIENITVTNNGIGALSLTNSDDSVATAEFRSNKIQVVAKKPGTTTITVISTDGSTVSCNVTVKKSVEFAKKTATLRIGDSEEIAYTNSGNGTLTKLCPNDGTIAISFSSTDPIMTVTGIKTGTTTVTLASSDGSSSSCEITVLSSVALDKDTVALAPGTSQAISFTLYGNRTLIWESSDDSIATVNVLSIRQINVVGKKPGTAVITGKCSDGSTATLNVTVDEKTIGVTYDPNGGSVATTVEYLNYGDKYSLPIPIRNGYTFDGWYTDKEGGVRITSASVFTESDNQQLYAHWICDCPPLPEVFRPGDVNGDDAVDSDDAIHLLYYTLLPDLYPINQEADFNGDGEVDSDDAIYLLYYTLLPELYPLN